MQLGMMVCWYDDPADDGSMDSCEPVYEGLVRGIEDSGYGLSGHSRELYREFNPEDLNRNITELQMPISR